MAETKLSMKLLINTETNKVLFAEAGKQCVDFLFHILSLPLATVIKLVQEQGMVGCLSNLYEIVENLNDIYIQPGMNKDTLLNPIVTTPVSLFLLQGYSTRAETDKSFYKCCQVNDSLDYSSCDDCFDGCCEVHCQCTCKGSYYSDDQRAICPECDSQMTTSITYVAPPSTPAPGLVMKKVCDEGGFVKGVVSYMVMDDLVVKPMSTISSLTLINKFNVKDIKALKEKEVHLGLEQAVKLLKASLKSKQVLTKVFFNKNS